MGLADLFGGESQESNLGFGQEGNLRHVNRLINDNLGKGIDPYTGQLVARNTSNQQAAFNGMPGAMQGNPNLTNAISSSLSGAGDPAAVRSMYNEALGPAQLEHDRMQNQTANRYGDTWGSNGAMAEMMARGDAEYGMGLNRLLGELTYNDQNAARDRQAQSIMPAVAARGMDIEGMNSLYNMGVAEQNQNQSVLTSAYMKDASERWYNHPALALLGPGLGTQAYRTQQNTGLIPGITNTIGGIASAIGAFYGGGAAVPQEGGGGPTA